jgi:hypothetical protein
MSDKLSWQEFRKVHTGINKELKTKMWNAYKTQDKETYLEAVEEAEIETPEEAKAYLGIDSDTESTEEVIEEEGVEAVSGETTFVEYARLMQQLHRFPHAYDAVQKREMEDRLTEIAKETTPINYKCTPTDGWQIWFGPTQQCLLINTTRHLAFTCSRSWWQTRFLSAMYVDKQLVNDAQQIARMRAEYEIRNKLIKRPPLPGVEIMVPTTAREYTMRG